MALFIDTFVNRIDRKGRVSVPATFRVALEGQSFRGIVAFPAFRYPALQCAGMDFMERLNAGVNTIDLFSSAHDDLSAVLFADAKQLAFDGEGRVVLPGKLIEHAKLGDLAAFVGRGQAFEIWRPEEFDKAKATARQRALEKGLTVPAAGEGKR
jgi:MraZ protein